MNHRASTCRVVGHFEMLPVSARISSRINMHRCVMPPAAASLAATCWCCRPSLLLHPDSKMSTSFEEPSRSLGWRPNTEPATYVFSKHGHDRIGPHREVFFPSVRPHTRTHVVKYCCCLLAFCPFARSFGRACCLLASHCAPIARTHTQLRTTWPTH